MAITITRKLVLCVCFLIIVIIGELYAFSLHFETRAVVLRAHFVILIEVFLYFVSKFLWNNLADLPICAPNVTTAQNTAEIRPWSAWKTLLLVYFLLCHCSYFTNIFLIGKDPHWFAMLTYSALGSYLQLATAMLILKAFNMGIYFITWWTGGSVRNTFFSKRSTAALAILYAVCAAFYGLTAAAQIPRVKKVSIPIRDLPKAWENTHIVQFTDVHLGPTVGFSKLSAIVDIINSLKPDIVVMTGDLVDGSVKLLNEAVAPLARVKSVYGNFFVTGNHEYYTGDADNWLQKLKDIGFMPLHNSHVNLIPTAGSSNDVLCIAGGDDLDALKLGYSGHGFDIDRTLQSCDPQHPVILLAHQPWAAKAALDSDYRVDLVLSGHTHGGQFFPMMIGAYFINPFFAGLYRFGQSSHIYVSEGTQYWGIPMRLGTTMEITDITLHAATS